MKRYNGQSGLVTGMPEPPPPPPPVFPPEPGPGPGPRPPAPPLFPGLDLSRLLADLETQDLLLMLILAFLYRESGDIELLVILAAMFLL